MVEKSKISSLEVISLLNTLEKTKDRLKEIRRECQHDFEVLSTICDFDDYYDNTFFDIDYVHCKICGKTQYIEK